MAKIDVVDWMIEELDGGGAVELVVVANADAAASRGAGAWMAVAADGSSRGTVGGGRLEQLAIERARELIARRSSCAARYDIGGKAEHAGAACGGVVDLCFAYMDAVARNVLADVREVLAKRGSGVLAIDLAPLGEVFVAKAPAKTIEGGLLVGIERVEDQAAIRVGFWQGRYLEPLCPEGFAYVIGCGHVGRALVPVLARAGFAVIACDDRPEFLAVELLPDAAERRLVSYTDLAASIQIGSRDLVVCGTSSHGTDLAVVAQAMAAGPAYLGCLGSAKKTAFFEAKLAERGFAPGQIESLHMPVGVPIACETPDEIAISIAAEMVDFRRTELLPRR